MSLAIIIISCINLLIMIGCLIIEHKIKVSNLQCREDLKKLDNLLNTYEQIQLTNADTLHEIVESVNRKVEMLDE